MARRRPATAFVAAPRVACFRSPRVAQLDVNIAKMEPNLGLLDPENLPAVQVQLRKLRQERQGLLCELAEAEALAPTASLEGVIGRVSAFVRAAKEGNPADLRAVIQETVEQVRLDIEMVQKKVNKRSKLVGGEVELKSVALSGSGTGTGSRCCSGSRPTTPR